jgi:hypothetical protein
MGQAIEVEPQVVGDVAIFATDRSLTGQDGSGYESAAAAASDDRFPGRLAQRLYAADDRLNSVWIASNTAVLRRDGGWDDTAQTSTADVIRRFFLYY